MKSDQHDPRKNGPRKKPEYLIALATYWTGSVGIRSHSIFWWIHLPQKSTIHVGKYTIFPMDPSWVMNLQWMVAYNPPIGSIYHLYIAIILPSGGLYATYHLLGEPETTIDSIFDGFKQDSDQSWSTTQHPEPIMADLRFGRFVRIVSCSKSRVVHV